MSQLRVTGLEVDNILLANNIAGIPNVSINSTAFVLTGSSTNLVMNTSSLTVGNTVSNTEFQQTISVPNITVNGNTVTLLAPNEICNVQILTANGTWTKPSWATNGAELVIVHMWGGGGGGSIDTNYGSGGGGGAFVFGIYMANQVGATANVTVGLGGNAAITQGQYGGSSIFRASNGSALFAYGGGPATNASGTGAGGGGGWFSSGSSVAGGLPLDTYPSSTFGGGDYGGAAGGTSIYGGGCGGKISVPAGNSVYGGAGGCWKNVIATSIYGGAGGNSSVAASTPGGGGGGSNTTTSAGARGEVRVYTLRKLA